MVHALTIIRDLFLRINKSVGGPSMDLSVAQQVVASMKGGVYNKAKSVASIKAMEAFLTKSK